MSLATLHVIVRVAAGFGVLAAAWASLDACSSDVRIANDAAGTSSSGNVGGGGVGNIGPGTGAAPSAASSGGADAGEPCVPGPYPTQCYDCIDNDGDGAVDGWDSECLGPLDNDEGSFANGIPDGCTDGCKLDCGFDGNSGAGDDGCLQDLSCYFTSEYCSPEAGPSCLVAAQKCVDACLPITPNGCDCFGCCDVARPDGSHVSALMVACLSVGCSVETLDDPEACPPCQPVPDCYNPCEHCEYCLGKTVLPADCPADGDQGCSADQEKCSPTSPCPQDEYCLTGCCIPFPL